MGWKRKRNSDPGVGESLGPIEISTSGSGMIVQGSPTAVSAFVDQMLEATKGVGGRARHFVVDGVQVASNVAAFHQTHREYIEFSDRAIKLLKKHGAIATKDGNFRSFVRNGRAIAGNLDWKPVNLGPEQALSLQAAAGQLALRAAIREVTVALERIEGKIDKLAHLAEAERLWPGDLGDRAVKSMNDGLRQFAPGVQMTIRNGAAHGTADMAEQDALERLAVLSLLARWTEECVLVEAAPA
jgi:phytoene dehydrogenase-like protein